MSIVDFLKQQGQDSSFEARSGMAQEAGIFDYTGTAQQNIQLLESLQIPQENVVITPDDLQTAQPIALPPQQPEVSGLSELIDLTSERARQREIDLEASRADMDRTFQQIQQFPERAEEIRGELGISALERGVDEISSLIQARSRGLQRQLELMESQPIATGMIGRQQQQAARETARELADLSVVQMARQGQLDSARDVLNRKIEMELEPLRMQLEFDRFFYQENRQLLTAEQDREFKLKIAREEREYNAEREKRQQINNIALQAAVNGGSPELVSRIGQSDSFEEALETGAEQLGVPFMEEMRQRQFDEEMQQARLEVEMQSLRLRESDIRFNQTIQLAQMGHTGSIEALGLTVDGNRATETDLSFAREFAETGKMPSGVDANRRPLIEQLALEIPKRPGQVVSSVTGVTPSSLPASVIQDFSTSFNLFNQVEELREITQELPSNAFTRTMSRLTPSGREAIRQYQNKRNEIIRELRRRDYGARPSEWTLEELERRIPGIGGFEREGFFSFIPTRDEFGVFSNRKAVEKIDETLSFMDSTLDSQLSGQGVVMYGFSQIDTAQGRFTVGDVLQTQEGRRFILNADGSYTEITQ